jgi:hypothetical protein
MSAKKDINELIGGLDRLKKQSVERMEALIKEDNGWLALSKEAGAHKMILGSLLGKPIAADTGDNSDDDELAEIMRNA